MARRTIRAQGADVEIVRQQMAVNPPDAGSEITVELDADGTATVAWMCGGRRCSVGAAIIVIDE